MKPMKKLLAVLLAAMMVFCLAACGDKDDDKGKKSDSKHISDKGDDEGDSAKEKADQKTDVANARALKSLVVARYMAGDFDDPVCQAIASLSDNETATLYLDKSGQDVITEDDDLGNAMKISADWDGCDYGKYVCVMANRECLIVGSEPEIPSSTNNEDKDDSSEKDDDSFVSAFESSNQKTDIANTRALKSLVVAQYMAGEGYVYETVSALKGTETADFYLTKDGMSVSTNKNDRAEITAKWDGCDYGKYICVTVDMNCMIVDSEPELPAA